MKMKYMIFYIVLLPLALGLISDCSTEKELDIDLPSLSSSILTEGPITIGDPIDIALIIYHRKNDDVVFPEESTNFLPFSLYDTIIKTRRVRGHIYKTMVIYTVTIFETGEFSFGPFQVKVGNHTLTAEKLDISVLSVIPKNVENPTLKDIVPPYRARLKPIMFVIIPLSLIGAAALAYFLRKFLRRRPDEDFDLVFAEKPINPYEFSITELTKLKKTHSENRTEIKSIYSKISIVLRFFIGTMLDFSALKMTTCEIKRYLGKKGDNSIPAPRLMSILKRSDMVKFAKEKPEQQRVESDIDESIEIVEKVHEIFSLKEEVGSTDDV